MRIDDLWERAKANWAARKSKFSPSKAIVRRKTKGQIEIQQINSFGGIGKFIFRLFFSAISIFLELRTFIFFSSFSYRKGNSSMVPRFPKGLSQRITHWNGPFAIVPKLCWTMPFQGFQKIYKQFFPQGDPIDFSNFVFKTYDDDQVNYQFNTFGRTVTRYGNTVTALPPPSIRKTRKCFGDLNSFKRKWKWHFLMFLGRSNWIWSVCARFVNHRTWHFRAKVGMGLSVVRPGQGRSNHTTRDGWRW